MKSPKTIITLFSAAVLAVSVTTVAGTFRKLNTGKETVSLEKSRLITRVRDNESPIDYFTMGHKSLGDPTGSPDFFSCYRLLPEFKLPV